MHPSATGLVGVIGALVLGIVIAYGIIRNRTLSRRNAQIGEAATREEYAHPESYDPEEFRSKLGPNDDGTMPKKN